MTKYCGKCIVRIKKCLEKLHLRCSTGFMSAVFTHFEIMGWGGENRVVLMVSRPPSQLHKVQVTGA